MKTLLIMFFVLFSTIFCYAQRETPEFRTNINEVEVSPPLFTGVRNVVILENEGASYFKNYIIDNLNYDMNVSSPEGTEVVSFVITSSGRVADVKIVNSVDPEIDEEFIRVIENTNGMWKPGLKDGKYAAMPQEVSVIFSLNSNTKATIRTFQLKAEHYFTRASISLFEKQNFKRAESLFDRAILYLPHDCSSLVMRGLCRFGRGDKDGAMEDWTRVKNLGGIDITDMYYAQEIQEIDGFKELMTLLDNK